jgi:dTDP-4-dehydrorhamnose reductase
MKILGTGLTGLVGSRIVELLSNTYDFENISRSTGVDITHTDQIKQAIKNSKASVVLHLAAKANVDVCEQDWEGDTKIEEDNKNNDSVWAGKETAWAINVIGTKHVVQACREAKKKLLFMSTDFVFSGEDIPEGGYTEDQKTAPGNWYAITKAKAEDIVRESDEENVIIRPAFPYTYLGDKKHFVSAIFNRLQSGQPVAAVTDEIFTPTWMDDLAQGIDILIQKNEKGIFHIGGASVVSPYDCAYIIAETFNLDTSLISRTDRKTYFAGKAKRPFNTSLRNDKIQQLGLKLTTFQEGLNKIKNRKVSSQ